MEIRMSEEEYKALTLTHEQAMEAAREMVREELKRIRESFKADVGQWFTTFWLDFRYNNHEWFDTANDPRHQSPTLERWNSFLEEHPFPEIEI